jgi:hypothetical protein
VQYKVACLSDVPARGRIVMRAVFRALCLSSVFWWLATASAKADERSAELCRSYSVPEESVPDCAAKVGDCLDQLTEEATPDDNGDTPLQADDIAQCMSEAGYGGPDQQ